MSYFYCFKCDKLQPHIIIDKIIETSTTLLKCNVCGEEQKFTQEDYVKIPKVIIEC